MFMYKNRAMCIFILKLSLYTVPTQAAWPGMS